MPDEVTLDVTTIEENVTVETTAGDVVEIQVLAPSGAAATITVGTTTTGAAGTNASVTNSGTTSAAVFNFTIPQGAAGANGGSSTAWNYRAKTNATSGYPTNGHLLWNNATQLSATQILVSHLNDDDTDIELFLSFFVEGQKLFIQNRDDSSQNQIWEITGTPTVTNPNTSTSYYTFPVTLVSSQGAAFTNNHSILFGTITEATNSVTSATTSDGTATLSVLTLGVVPSGSITLASTNSGGFVLLSGQAATDARSIAFPNASGTLALVASTTGQISFADISDAQTGTADLILENLTATNLGSGTASIGSALIVGDGDSVKGRYDIFGNTSHFQWYSSSALYGEREFTITTENLTSSGSYSYKYPVGTGTFALTANISGEPDKLTAGTISGATTFNATSYTYGTGAAAAHRTALGLTTLATTTPAANVATFLETPTSANLASALTDETGSGSLVFATSPTLTTPTINSATIGTAATFNATSYTYGTGAATEHMASIVSGSGINNIFCYDEFVGTSATGGGIGELGWTGGTTVAIRGNELGHPGILRVSATATGSLFLNYLAGAGNPDSFNGLTVEGVFRIGAITNCRHIFGVGYVNAYLTNGFRGITFDPANSANWRLHHRTSAGVDTFTDTGKAAVANDWVRVKLTFASGLTTCTIATTTSTTDATVTNSGAYTVGSAAHTPQWIFQATSGTQTLDVDAFMMHGKTTRL